jgi:CRP-like cAMP-binding protein
MTTRQLAGLAMFGEVRTFERGERIVVEGTASDGFYVLLSGHLSVVAGGWTVGELLEGEIFGEIGLLEGGPRQATVAVASADADALFISTETFRRLLDSLPSFAWGIHEMVEQRRQKSPSDVGWRRASAGARAWEPESAERHAMPGRVEAT